MQAFSEFIVESFHSETDVIWVVKSQSHAVAKFQVKSISVEIDFEQREHRGAWHVAFNTTAGEISDRTNMALAFRIFNGVFQAVREFIETREPEVLIFISKDEDLAGIYETYLRREKAALEALGYRLEAPERVQPYAQFTLRRLNPSQWRE